ncbi:unnamed protein product [Peniophora sp. CBMAI 1063]|nr:unnamed protein product [Peniophora sp. CBMAI 1063]
MTASTPASMKQGCRRPPPPSAPAIPLDMREKRCSYGWKVVVNMKTYRSQHPEDGAPLDVRDYYEDEAQGAGMERGVHILLSTYDTETTDLTMIIWLARNFVSIHTDRLLGRTIPEQIPTEDLITKFCRRVGFGEPEWFTV